MTGSAGAANAPVSRFTLALYEDSGSVCSVNTIEFIMLHPTSLVAVALSN